MMPTPDPTPRRFYDHLTRLFLALGSAPRAQTIHRAVWLRPGLTLAQALESTHALLAAEIASLPASQSALHIADLGCGVGASLFALLRGLPASTRAVGVTISPLQAALAARNARRSGLDGAARFVVADFQALPLRPGFDFAYSVEAFVHASHPAAYFDQAAALLRPGGRLALVDDFLERDLPDLSPAQRRMLRVFQRGWHAPGLCALNQAVALAQASGLRLVKHTDLTPFLRLRALPDALARALAALGDALPGEQLLVRNLLGSMALQQCLRAGVSGYHLLVFEK